MKISHGIALASSLLGGVVDAAASQAFTWNNVRIGGGGGFIPGIVFNPSLKGLAYARADIGGPYRLNSDDSWTPLVDFANNTNWHDWGCDAIATDPIDTDRVYIAAGMYTNSWDPNNGSILRSTDQGNTWAETKLPFKVGGNMPGRGIGERLAVDPNLNSIIYFGARSGNGLWKSTDYGVTFNKVAAFIWPGTYFQAAGSDYTDDPVGIAWITFDGTSGKTGAATPRIFVGVVDAGQSVFKSEDGGVTWAWVSGEPQYGFIPHKGVLSPAEHTLYVSYANGVGPYDGTNGTVHKYNISTGIWTEISPTPMASTYYGYGGLAVDLQKPGTIMVAALNSWWPDAIIWRSLDSGTTWSPIWAWDGYPTIDYYYSYNIASAPWLQYSDSTAQFLQRVGWMIEALVIDPFDSNHWLYGTGATMYGGHDLLKWDTTHNVTLESLATGIEEEAVLGLLVPPGGPPLLSVVGDDGGFYHSSLTTAPSQAFDDPAYGSSYGLDYAGNTPADIVRTGTSTTAIQIATSGNFGATWAQYYGANLYTYPGAVAYSANADTILLSSTENGTLVSRYSATFSSVSTLPAGAAIASDKRNNSMFYGGSGGSFYVSSDIGVTFKQTVALGSSTVVNKIRVHPTVAGDVWASTDVGLFHSTNFGATFTQVGSACAAGYDFALGAGATTSAYPVIYGFFTVDGVTALFKTEDKGVNWQMISDATHGFGASSSNVVGADMSIYGRVFVGTNGRGIFYGAPLGSLPSPTATASGSTSTSTSISTSSSSSIVSKSTTLSTSTVKSSTSSSSTKSTSSSSVSSKTTASSTSVKSSTSVVKSSTTVTTAAPAPSGTSSDYGQCAGIGYTGPTGCPTGWTCVYSNAYYSQCLKS